MPAASASPAAPAAPTFGDDPALLARVLTPYRPDCRYLLSTSTASDDELALSRGEFAIGESCYIDDTGHFNAVEFNICYNQLTYFLIAKSVQEGLAPEFRRWTMDDFWARQLPGILIAGFTSRFHAPIDPRSFHGEVRFDKILRRTGADGSLVMARTSCRFWDDADGRADGEVRLAFVDPPDGVEPGGSQAADTRTASGLPKTEADA
ncbi:FcoT family thioesterase [Streptomycetaceae bacterium NBC_01309]